MKLRKSFLTAVVSVSSMVASIMIGTSAFAAGPTDAEIADTVMKSNELDINAAKLAKSKSQSKDVQSFADMMIDDHTKANKETSDLAAKLKLTPKSDADVMKMSAKATASEAKLKALSGRDFDKAYLESQVAFHQAVLDDLDKKLIPSAQEKQLKDLLAKVRPTVQMHLEHAKSLVAAMK